MRFRRSTFLAASLTLAAFACAAPVRLAAGDVGIFEIEPSTLETSLRTSAGERVPIAAAGEASGATEINADAATARWRLAARKLSVTARVDCDALLMTFAADVDDVQIAWPIVRGDAGVRSLVVPMFEGLCIPSDDETWATFLIDHGPLNTTGDLSMPFFATLSDRRSVTYMLENPFNNAFAFEAADGRLGMRVTHDYPVRKTPEAYAVRVQVGDASPVAPAKVYRQSLIERGEFVTLKAKIERTPDVAKLIGAAHAYVWGAGMLCVDDVRDVKALAAKLREAADASIAGRLWSKMSTETQQAIRSIATAEFVDRYTRRVIVEGINEAAAAEGITPDEVHEAFGDAITAPDTWGNGTSTRMLDALADAKLDRLWLGSPDFAGLADHPAFVARAKQLGYLVGPYDSYHSIHRSTQADTWETAQFSDELFESGGVMLADGKTKRGFKQVGAIFSPHVARPAVEERVNRLAPQFACNSWFIDCDATGECFDDYSPTHPSTQRQDIAERLSRMAWIRDTHKMVIGSEGGAAFAAPVIDYAHGMMTPVIAWGDEQMYKDRTSPFYLGRWYPADQPDVFFKPVPMKPELSRVYADPRYRVPLYQTVFHDSVIATHHWGYGSLKFKDPQGTRQLLELLYNVPPLYHLTLDAWRRDKGAITKHYAFWSPLHRKAATLPMTAFRWLSDDRLVQQTTFGEAAEMVLTANFGEEAFTDSIGTVPPHAIRAVTAEGTSVFEAAP